MSSHVSRTTYRADWFNGLGWLGSWLPRPFVRFCAAWVGLVYAWTHPRKTAIVAANLGLISPEARKLAPHVYAEFGRVMADYFYLARRPLAQAIHLVQERHGFDHLQAAYQAGRGALLLTPHLSFFELGSVVMQENGYPMVALTSPEPSAALTAWRAAYRLRWGVETMEVGQDDFQFLQIVRSLSAGKFVAALFDRPHPTQSFSAHVPHGSLRCSSGVLLLALLAKCPVLPVTVVARRHGGYRLEALAPIVILKKGTTAETLQHYTQVLVDVLWPTIATHPEQWFQFAPLPQKPA